MFCNKCNKLIPEGLDYCPECKICELQEQLAEVQAVCATNEQKQVNNKNSPVCEKCNKLIPDSLSYCPSCKSKDEKTCNLPVELTGSLINTEEPLVHDIKKDEIDPAVIEANSKSNGFVVVFIIVIVFGAVIVLQNNLFGNDDYENFFNPPIHNNTQPPNEGDYNNQSNTDNPATGTPGANIPAGHSLYRLHISEEHVEWFQGVTDEDLITVYFISDVMHGNLIENVRIAVVRDRNGTTISPGRIPGILDVILPNEYGLLMDMVSLIEPRPRIIVLPQGRQPYIYGTQSNTEQIKNFIRAGR